MRKGWRDFAWVISWIYLICGNSWDSLEWPFPLSLVSARDSKPLPLSEDVGHPIWNSGGGGLCTAASSDTATCWLSMDIIHTYKINEIRTKFSIHNLRWAIWRRSSGRNLYALIGQVCIQPPDLNILRYVFCLHMGKHMFSQFQRLVWKKSIFSGIYQEIISFKELLKKIALGHLPADPVYRRGESKLLFSPSTVFFVFFSWESLLRQQDIRRPTWQTKNSVLPLSFLSSCFPWGSLFFLYDWTNYPDKAKDWDRCSP